MEAPLPQPPRDENPSGDLPPQDLPQTPENPPQAAQDGSTDPSAGAQAPQVRNRKTRMGITDARRVQNRVDTLMKKFVDLRDDLLALAGEEPTGLKLKLAQAANQLDLADTHMINAYDLIHEVHETLDAL